MWFVRLVEDEPEAHSLARAALVKHARAINVAADRNNRNCTNLGAGIHKWFSVFAFSTFSRPA
jgi:hypothetical protein